MSRPENNRSALLALVLAIAFTNHVAAQQDQLIFKSSPESLAAARPNHATNLQFVRVNLELVESLKVQSQFNLMLYGNDYRAIVDEVRPQVDGCTVRGYLDGQAGSFFVITVVDDAVAGSFYLPGVEQNMVRLRYAGPNGLHYLHKIAPGFKNECGVKSDSTHELGEKRRAEVGEKLADIFNHLEEYRNGDDCNPTNPTFDVMLVYTPAARIAAGGTAAIRAECINAVEVTEETYLICGVLLIRTKVAAVYEVAYDETNRSYSDHLTALIDPDDGILDAVHLTRNDVEGDFVSLIVADNETGGLGICNVDEADAMSVCRWDLIVDNFTLAHEMGHNIGCGHDRVTGDSCGWENGYGYFFLVPSENTWRHTVMSYTQNNSTRLPHYSNPLCQYRGVPTGTPESDNLSVIFARQYVCESFRHSRLDVWVDFNYTGTEDGSSERPFNTLIEAAIRALVNPTGDIPIVHLKPGSRAESVTINKPMFLQACGGTVTIGQ